ncbi:MAG TPA: tRNA (adenosine(37)-N6)-threonylcarbamoyltransferase complex transferase subunit TsaD [Cyclobacteriaceae bacterium]|nr:tRNA (adenosine(37)-N6)-threonylcarbamoyltransferase complex transferase subunit TsaD [Cyclobacteriaceae bacterium]
MDIKLLAIESSCDETSAAISHNGRILSNVVVSQAIHEIYGGVVPELASRSHQRHIIPVVHAALEKSGIDKKDLTAVAYTRGPGLLGSLLVGATFAKAFAAALEIPVIEINHMQAHILAHFIDDPKPEFPFLCLTVSGGHTQIVQVNDLLKMKILGETIDDAAGEAFDKTAKLLGLPYPGGHLIDTYARLGNPRRFTFPGTEIRDYDFSFSGLKTSVLYFLREKLSDDKEFITKNLNDICASVQFRIIDLLLKKLELASASTGISIIAIAGGVSANSMLREKLNELSVKNNWQVFIPRQEYCTDNAAMIAIAGYFKYRENLLGDFSSSPDARLKY